MFESLVEDILEIKDIPLPKCKHGTSAKSYLNCTLCRHNLCNMGTDMEKFQALFDDVGIQYNINGSDIEINQFHADGLDDCCIFFYDDGEFQDFGFYGDKDMKLCGIGNVTKAELEKVISDAEMKRYEGNIQEISRLYKYKKAKEYFGFARETSLRMAYSSIPKDAVDKLTAKEFIQIMEWKIGK